MNRQQRRQAERAAKKQTENVKKAIQTKRPDQIQKEIETNPLVQTSFREGQILNNHEWAVRLERIKDVKGIGPKLMSSIFAAIEEPLTYNERIKARQQYESGADL